jgi:two-component system CheB/CheR fusion protein
MPQSAVRSGCVDFVLPPEAIARELVRISQHPYLAPVGAVEKAVAITGDEEHYNRILELLHSSVNVDFNGYRDTTIRRRILRRMAL